MSPSHIQASVIKITQKGQCQCHLPNKICSTSYFGQKGQCQYHLQWQGMPVLLREGQTCSRITDHGSQHSQLIYLSLTFHPHVQTNTIYDRVFLFSYFHLFPPQWEVPIFLFNFIVAKQTHCQPYNTNPLSTIQMLFGEFEITFTLPCLQQKSYD